MRLVVSVTVVSMMLLACNPSNSSPECQPSPVGSSASSSDGQTLHLWVSNQSFDIDPVLIEIYIDDRRVVCQVFYVEGQHNWILFDLVLEPGNHTLRAIANSEDAELTETFDHTIEQWAVVDFWFYAEHGEPQHLTFSIQDEPIGFA